MFEKVNTALENYFPFITPLFVLGGMTIFSFLHSYAFLVPWIFACITFSSSLGLKVKEIGHAIKNPLPIFICLMILQVIMPLIAFGVGHLFFADDIYIVTGLVLAFIIPTGIVSLMWVSIYKGSSSTTLTIILANTMLAPFLVPLSLQLLIGTEVSLPIWGVMKGLIWMVVIPSIIGLASTHFFTKSSGEIKKTLAPFAKAGLLLVIAINCSVAAPFLKDTNVSLLKLFVTLLLLTVVGYVLGFTAAKLFKWDHSIGISLTYSSGLRNNGVGSALAVTYFPPQVSIPIIVVILFQQVLAAAIGKIIVKSKDREEKLKKIAGL
ncbi:bile acid:sodium symporter family protein [Alkalihalobacillus sp. 1P02AB]|uniref:bile acid:sodium symporter family protein n=1 Tax=Alkalihalobacillus sp. 1P02AB TaxID=3132260 RepID=UPI0039A40735